VALADERVDLLERGAVLVGRDDAGNPAGAQARHALERPL
jgi:hypothetical protein